MRSEAWEIYNRIDPEAVRQEYLRCVPQLLSFDKKITIFTKSSLQDAI